MIFKSMEDFATKMNLVIKKGYDYSRYDSEFINYTYIIFNEEITIIKKRKFKVKWKFDSEFGCWEAVENFLIDNNKDIFLHYMRKSKIKKLLED